MRQPKDRPWIHPFGAAKRHLFEADLNQELPPPLHLNDGLLALDVIEHLDDDRQAIRHLGQLLRPGGVAVVSAPGVLQVNLRGGVV